jgi:Ca2+-binding EF-hand superfamily protein
METRMAERKARRAGHGGKAGAKMGHRVPMDFAAIDANRDGYLVRSELRAHHERMRPQHEAARKARFEQKFAAADLNKDGKLGRVEAGQAMPRIGERFNWMDDNRDGFLDRNELASGRGHRR